MDTVEFDQPQTHEGTQETIDLPTGTSLIFDPSCPLPSCLHLTEWVSYYRDLRGTSDNSNQNYKTDPT